MEHHRHGVLQPNKMQIMGGSDLALQLNGWYLPIARDMISSLITVSPKIQVGLVPGSFLPLPESGVFVGAVALVAVLAARTLPPRHLQQYWNILNRYIDTSHPPPSLCRHMHPAALTGDGPAPALHGAGVPAMSSPLAVTCRSRYIWISTVCRLRSARPGGCLTTNQTPGRPALPATLTTQHQTCSPWRTMFTLESALPKSPTHPFKKHLLALPHLKHLSYGHVNKFSPPEIATSTISLVSLDSKDS